MKIHELLLFCYALFTTALPPVSIINESAISIPNIESSGKLEPNPICAICFEPVFKPFHYFTCSHSEYHSTCIYEYEKKPTFSCPLCRAPVNPLLPNNVFISIASDLVDSNMTLFNTMRTKYIMTDPQTLGIIRSALQTNIFHDILSKCTLRDWNTATNFFYATFIRDFYGLWRVSGVAAEMKLVIRMGSLSSGHARMHGLCIHRSMWSCSDAFFAFYIETLSTLDLTDLLKAAVVRRVSRYVFDQFIALPDGFLNDAGLFAALKISLSEANWEALSILFNLIINRSNPTRRSIVVRYLLENVALLPLYITCDIINTGTVSKEDLGVAIGGLLRLSCGRGGFV